MAETVYRTGKTPQQILNDRLKNSGSGTNPSFTVQHGTGARRVFHNVHNHNVPGVPRQLNIHRDYNTKEES